MPSLQASLKKEPLEYLQIVAHCWQLDAPEPENAASVLAGRMLNRELVLEIVAALPAEALKALRELLGEAGRMRWLQFTRKHGEVRKMGAARLQREKPHLAPQSAAEILFFRALIAAAYFDTPDGALEFAFIPDDLIALLPDLPAPEPVALGRPAADADCAHPMPAGDSILDDSTTLLAGLRLGLPEGIGPEKMDLRAGRAFLEVLFLAHGLTGRKGQLNPSDVRQFLEQGRAEGLLALVRTWLNSKVVDELRLVPGLRFEGAFENDPVRTRLAILDMVRQVSAGEWWHIQSFIAAVKERYPDFQRREGEYDSWYIQDVESAEFLRGFDNWDRVEGRLLHWVITGPLHWLGLVDLAGPEKQAPPLAFRMSAFSANLLHERMPEGLSKETDKIHVLSTGLISATGLVPRAARYQVSRFCEWEPVKAGEYRYRPTPSSLQQAGDGGLQVDALVALLARYSDGIPPNVTRALKDWQYQGKAARISSRTVLQLSSPEALEALRASRAARFLGETLGPAAVTITTGSEDQVISALMELGYLGEVIH